MNLEYFSFTEIRQLSKRDVKFQTDPELFQQFLSYPFSLESFSKKIEDRQKYPVDRDLLADVILDQYESSGVSNIPRNQIESLRKEDTYTVVTAHQPSLLTGPLYFIYKIISVINLAERLNEEYDQTVVPVFIIGSEDHDFEEINHLSLFGKEVKWENGEGGAVGRMSTKSLDPVLEQVYDILGTSEYAEELKKLISTSFENTTTYNQGVFRMVHQLFSKYNLVLLITDDKRLKQAFIPHIKKEIFNTPSQDLIVQTQNQLAQLDLKGQAHAREINFFYLQDGRRDRIEYQGDVYSILNTDVTFSKEELDREIEENPERFSPNVVMRPIYQETILPNLAYLGGGGEIAYWTERKSQFEAFEVSFPILIRRNSVLWLSKGDQKQLQKYGVESNELFDTDEDWVQSFVKEQASSEIEFSEEFALFNKAYELLAQKAKSIDPNLSKSIEASGVKAFKSFEQLSSRLLRTEKDRHETEVKRIRKLHSKLFPNGGLQERTDNFIPFYLKHGDAFIQVLKDSLDPFNKDFLVISEI